MFEPLFGLAEPAASQPGWLAALAAAGGFAADPRLAEPAPAAGDPGELLSSADLAAAYAEGERAGRAAAEAELAAREEARTGLALALARLDEELGEQLAARLAEVVAALCERTMAPFALDADALQRRCIAAAAMVGDGIIDASLRLHPADIDLLDPAFVSTWHVLPDPALERGSVVLDTAEGAVMDGPAQWRAALAEALGSTPPAPGAR